MASAPGSALNYEIEKSTDDVGNQVTTLKLRGRIVSDTAGQLRDLVKPLIPLGGRIQLDLNGVEHMDSSGLGTLVGLKASAINAGYCRLELINLTPRVADLLRITKLTQLLAS